MVCIARVESGLVTKVSRGENAGRTLAHVNVVREFMSVPIGEGGAGEWDVTTKAPASKEDHWIAFVQDASMAVLGATAVDP